MNIRIRLILGIAVLAVQPGVEAQEAFPILTGDYLGQDPPGRTPEVFAPGLLRTETKGAFGTVFSPDLLELYFVSYKRHSDGPSALVRMARESGRWSMPEPLPFSGKEQDNDLCLSTDGRKMIFRSWRPLADGTSPNDHSWLWASDLIGGEWSEARPLLVGGECVRTGYPSITREGTLYFSHQRDGRAGVFRARLSDGEYDAPEFVTSLFDPPFIHGDLFISPDETYLIVSGRDPEEETGHRRLDLFVLFRRPDGSWSAPIDLGEEINTSAGENCPQVTPDGRFFFFHRYDPDTDIGNIYWVDAGFISSLRGESVDGR